MNLQFLFRFSMGQMCISSFLLIVDSFFRLFSGEDADFNKTGTCEQPHEGVSGRAGVRCRKGRKGLCFGQWWLALVPGTCHSHIFSRKCLLGGGGSSCLVLATVPFQQDCLQGLPK